jgi:hypothetical protein
MDGWMAGGRQGGSDKLLFDGVRAKVWAPWMASGDKPTVWERAGDWSCCSPDRPSQARPDANWRPEEDGVWFWVGGWQRWRLVRMSGGKEEKRWDPRNAAFLFFCLFPPLVPSLLQGCSKKGNRAHQPTQTMAGTDGEEEEERRREGERGGCCNRV